MDVKHHGRLLTSTSELRNCVKLKVEVDVLGFPSLTVHTVSVDTKFIRAQELRESRGRGRPGLPVLNGPYMVSGDVRQH